MKATNRLALKEWSIVSRFLYEGSGILTFLKEYIPADREFFLFPAYQGQSEDALKPGAGMSYRHELRAFLAGHVYIRTYAEVMDSFEIHSAAEAKAVAREHAFTEPEMARRLEAAPNGLVAIALRVYRLSRPRHVSDREKFEGGDRFLSLPVEIATEGAVPALSDEDFERRLDAVGRALSRDKL